MNRSFVVQSALALAGVTALLSSPVSACNTPVCQYALENWEASPYLLIVCHKGELTPEQEKLLKSLEPGEDTGLRPNIEIYRIDMTKTDDRIRTQVEEALGKPLVDVVQVDTAPQTFVMWPFMYGQRNVPLLWSGPLSELDFRALTDSPLRRETAKRLLEGSSVVWLLAESGDAEADRKAAECLTENLKRLEGLIELPPPDLDPMLALDEQAPQQVVRPKFSLLPFKPGAPEERMFEEMLRIKALWEEKKAPLAFPIYGRGRVLTSLAGDEIDPEWIDEVSVFLTGPCSCQVKAGNPGYDLLMTVDWYAGLENRGEVEKALPPLISPSGMMQAVKTAAEQGEQKVAQADPTVPAGPAGLANAPESAAPAVAAMEEPLSPVIRNTLVVVAGVVIVIAIASLLMRSRRTQDT